MKVEIIFNEEMTKAGVSLNLACANKMYDNISDIIGELVALLSEDKISKNLLQKQAFQYKLALTISNYLIPF